ncbi:MAG: hypothetical protein ACRDRG_21530 [Pseudonocardiaceae bacterium]
MTRHPRFGELWLAPEGSLLPGGMLCLVVSADHVNAERDERIVVEVVGEALAATGALLVSLGPLGSAVIGTPFTVSGSWFAGTQEPIAVLDPQLAATIGHQLRKLIGP